MKLKIITQKILINEAKLCKKEVFIASNLLETMADELKPSRAEANDIVNSIIDSGKSTSDNKNNSSLESMLPSWSLFTLPHISYDGHMSACFCDFDSKLYMADLKKMSFLERTPKKTKPFRVLK